MALMWIGWTGTDWGSWNVGGPMVPAAIIMMNPIRERGLAGPLTEGSKGPQPLFVVRLEEIEC